MQLKYLVIFVVVIGIVAADQEKAECGDEKVAACLQTLIESMVEDPNEEEVCQGMQDFAQCIQETVDECLGGERDEDVEKALAEMESRIKQHCGGDKPRVVSEEIESCINTNSDYILSCIEETTAELVELFKDAEDVNENILKCTMYSLVSQCIATRVGEKCGEEAKEAAERELEDLPSDVREACVSEDTLDFFSVALLDDKRKKKK